MPHATVRAALLAAAGIAYVACSAAAYRDDADEQVYGIEERAFEHVTAVPKTFRLERPVDTLRRRLLEGDEKIVLSLRDALDVAAENSREFQRQKELLYAVALALTRAEHDFTLRFGGGGSADVEGTGNDEVDLILRDDLSASQRTTAGTSILIGFVNTFLRSIVHGGDFDGSSILSLTFTQPLLRGFGARIVREPLTQAERDVIYRVRDFERFRAEFAVQVATAYLQVVQQADNLKNVEANLQSLIRTREQFEAEQEAERRTRVDADRGRQEELNGRARLVSALASYQAALDRFKFTLGLPTEAVIELEQEELQNLRDLGVTSIDIPEDDAVALALERRFDYRNSVDEVEDAGRRILVAEDALRSSLDFRAVLSVPTEPGKPLKFDWDRVNWAAGFDLQLALDKLLERNAYRTALIDLDVFLRAREQLRDQVVLDVRDALRNIEAAYQSYVIQDSAVTLAVRRVDSTRELNQAGRATALDLLDAQDSLLVAQLALTGALVDYAVARMQLLRDLEALQLDEKGLQFDRTLPLPPAPLPGSGGEEDTAGPETPPERGGR